MPAQKTRWAAGADNWSNRARHPPIADAAPVLLFRRGLLWTARRLCALRQFHHSNSTVAGGLLVMSYTTRLTPLTSLTMRTLTRSSSS